MAVISDDTELIREIYPFRGIARITLDNGESFWLTRSAVREGGFQEGQEVHTGEFRRFVLLHQYPSALKLAVSMLARRVCSRGEIEQRLKRTRYDRETVEMVMARLDRDHLLNDEDFSLQWAHYRTGKKYGSRRIALELRQKGVSAGDVKAALESIDPEEETEQAVALARRAFARLKPEEDPRKGRQKVMAALVRRGYDWDTARRACSRVEHEDEEEE